MDEEIYKCWICMKVIDDYMLLPYENEYFGEQLTIFKNTFIIKDVDDYKFLYFYVCDVCIDEYLKKYGRILKYLRNREIGKR